MESTVSQKLEALSSLQEVDSNLDELKKVRGALPDEVMDLEDEIAGLETRIHNFDKEVKDLEKKIADHRTGIKDSEKLIKKYEEQQMNVRNNREYDAITKEIELQQLEIQIFEKKIKEAYIAIDEKKERAGSTQEVVDTRLSDLQNKKDELEQIINESEEEEKKLLKERENAAKKVDERIFKSYERIRTNVRNGLAVVPVKRGACGGCFNVVPPQKQAEIREKKKLIVCEHCGRIFSHVEWVEEPEEKKKPKRRTKKSA